MRVTQGAAEKVRRETNAFDGKMSRRQHFADLNATPKKLTYLFCEMPKKI